MTNLEKYGGHQRLHEFALPISASAGLEEPARPIAARFARAHRFFAQLLGREVQAGLVVLSPEDWAHAAAFPTYGVTYYRTLQDFEAQYGANDWTIENYAWYHGHFYTEAKRLYDVLGVAALRRMWQRFVVANVQGASDAQLADLLREVEPGLARMIEAWPGMV